MILCDNKINDYRTRYAKANDQLLISYDVHDRKFYWKVNTVLLSIYNHAIFSHFIYSLDFHSRNQSTKSR